MKTEKEKMLDGELYDSADPELVGERLRARELCHRINQMSPERFEKEGNALIEELLGEKTDTKFTPPFWCDYGRNLSVGKNVYFNFNCTILDVAEVRIGNNVLFGPNVQVLTATHPVDASERRAGLEYGLSIEIDDDVWIGGGAIVCPGVSIGTGSVVGAGSVVTKNVPEKTVVAGNPCRVIKTLG